MSGLLILAGCLAAVCTIPIAFVGARILRNTVRSEVTDAHGCTGCLLALVCFPILFMSLLPMLSWLLSSRATGITFKEASQFDILVPLPPTASNIDVWQRLQEVCLVDFSIKEKAFLAWANSNGWKPECISTTSLIETTQGELITLERGYFLSDESKGITVIVYYDSEKGRAYCQASRE